MLFKIILHFALSLMALSPALAQEPATSAAPAGLPRVWIFNGTPGDDEHHEFYEKHLTMLRKSLTTRFALPANHVRVFYGPADAGYEGPCTREVMLAELAQIVAHTRTPGAGASWIILQGHANPIAGGAMFNLPGSDVSLREIVEGLKGTAPGVPVVVIGTTTASADLVQRAAGPGRYIVTATTAGDKENETEFPQALAKSLAAPETDTNRDGLVSLTELFLATNAAVLNLYKEGDYIVKEHAQLDGNGDGKATQRPAPEDAEPAGRIGFRTGGGQPAFE